MGVRVEYCDSLHLLNLELGEAGAVELAGALRAAATSAGSRSAAAIGDSGAAALATLIGAPSGGLARCVRSTCGTSSIGDAGAGRWRRWRRTRCSCAQPREQRYRRGGRGGAGGGAGGADGGDRDGQPRVEPDRRRRRKSLAEAVKADVALEALDLHSCAVGNRATARSPRSWRPTAAARAQPAVECDRRRGREALAIGLAANRGLATLGASSTTSSATRAPRRWPTPSSSARPPPSTSRTTG